MGRPPVAPDAVQMSVRIPERWFVRADGLAEAMAVDGYRSDRASVWRAAIALGLVALEKKHGITPPKNAKIRT